MTGRQTDVLRLLCDGLTYKQTAARLGIAASTVRTHAHAAYGRLGVVNSAQAAVVMIRNGWDRRPGSGELRHFHWQRGRWMPDDFLAAAAFPPVGRSVLCLPVFGAPVSVAQVAREAHVARRLETVPRVELSVC